MRMRIIQGAIEETGEKGIKFTMSDLARKLGVSKRTLYENFISKEALMEAIIEHFFTQIEEKQEEILGNENLDPIQKLKEIARILPNDPKLTYISKFYEMKQCYPKQWRMVQHWVNEWKPEERLIEEGMKSGKLRKANSVVLRQIIVQSIMSLVDRNFLMKNDITLREALNDMIDIILYGLVMDEK
ncbi:TetR/AcrR family transcriptional regulator [Anaerophilus nitritogenes]|uniref:TetR/AcrR family transcriptional regulator n=1 Tax=Anaerophilus nitritogenes TaxID=2498136 RepID=UPI0013EB3B77|nr:TetR/AcrR family transcriptional regulator [Anaerophilus nitritogenes]